MLLKENTYFSDGNLDYGVSVGCQCVSFSRQCDNKELIVCRCNVRNHICCYSDECHCGSVSLQQPLLGYCVCMGATHVPHHDGHASLHNSTGSVGRYCYFLFVLRKHTPDIYIIIIIIIQFLYSANSRMADRCAAQEKY